MQEAFDQGAVCAIIPKDCDLDICDKAIIKVDDTFEALQNLGQYKRNKTNAKYIAITGSVGKTGTKNMLASVLSSYGETYATKGNFNNHYGLPLTLANMPETTEFAVIELGMNHAGEISELVKQVRPDIALITTVSACHIEFFNSIKEIAHAKSEIFEDLNGIAIINKESTCFDVMYEEAFKYTDDIITFGKDADVSLKECKCFENHSEILIDINGEIISYNLPIPGEHIALNSCGVFSVVKALNLNLFSAINAIEKSHSTSGRGKKIQASVDGKHIIITDESYNASPLSMIASIKTLDLSSGRKILVLGDMLELGSRSEEMHLSIIPTILESDVDKVYCCGKFMKGVYDALPIELQGAYAEYSNSLVVCLEKDLKNEDNVLIKGSNGSKMSVVVDFFKG